MADQTGGWCRVVVRLLVYTLAISARVISSWSVSAGKAAAGKAAVGLAAAGIAAVGLAAAGVAVAEGAATRAEPVTADLNLSPRAEAPESVAGSSHRRQQAQRLTDELTPLGAVRKGDDSGIPLWRGGVRTPPPGFTGSLVDAYPDEVPKLWLNEQSWPQQQAYLSAGLQRWLQQGAPPLAVFPSHRSSAAPDLVYEQAWRNHLRAEKNHRGGVLFTRQAIPFPIPVSGDEVIWNHLLAWRGVGWQGLAIEWQQHAGEQSRLQWQVDEYWPYYAEDDPCDLACERLLMQPARQQQRLLMARHWRALDPTGQSTGLEWRQRLLQSEGRPLMENSLQGEWPQSWSSDLRGSDDVSLFAASPSDYHWVLLGRQSLYIPYNNYRLALAETGPDTDPSSLWQNIRLEPHRVWVVDGTLKKGRRNPYHKRVYYLDEDSWQIALADFYNEDGRLQRVGLNLLVNDYRVPAVVSAGTLIVEPERGDFSFIWRQLKDAPAASLPERQHR